MEGVLAAVTLALLICAVYLVVAPLGAACSCRPRRWPPCGGERFASYHWTQQGTYGCTADTLPTYGLSGYNQTVPTPPWT